VESIIPEQKPARYDWYRYYFLVAGAVGAAGAFGASGVIFSAVAGTADGLLAPSTTDALFSLVYRYPSASVLITNSNAIVKVNLDKNPVGPFAPKSDSLLPL